MAAVVDVLRRGGINVGQLLALGNVVAHGSVQTQVFKSLYLIVHVKVGIQVFGVRAVVFQVEQCHGILGGVVVVGVGPVLVTQWRAGLRPLIVAAEVAVHGIAAPYRLRGIHPHGCADGVGVGIFRVGIHAFHVDVELQVVVEQTGIQVYGCRVAVEI